MVAVDHTGQPMLGALKSRKLVQPLGWKTILSQYLIRVVFCSSFDMPSTVMCIHIEINILKGYRVDQLVYFMWQGNLTWWLSRYFENYDVNLVLRQLEGQREPVILQGLTSKTGTENLEFGTLPKRSVETQKN